MVSPYPNDDDEDDDNVGLDEDFYKEMEALKRACQLRDQNDVSDAESASDEDEDEDEDSDEEVLRSIQTKLDAYKSVDLQAPCLGSEGGDEDEDEILRSVEKFCGSLARATRRPADADEGVTAVEDFGAVPGSQRSLDLSVVLEEEQGGGGQSSGNDGVEEGGGTLPEAPSTSVPARLQTLLSALNQNRFCQRMIRNLMHQVELKEAENKLLQVRVKSFARSERLSKRRSTGLFNTRLSNPILTFISNLRRRVSRRQFENPADASAMVPQPNPDVAKFQNLGQKLPLSFIEKKWTADEKNELYNGVVQQIQESRMQPVMDAIRSGVQDVSTLDAELKRIREDVITSDDIQEALPTLNWEEIAKLYVVGRSGQECKMQWMNYEDPSINKGAWSKAEDKKLLKIAQEHNFFHWDKVADLLGTNRTAAQCFSRYQRSLNASIMRSSWTNEEDEQLRCVVARFGESDWQSVAATMEGRTGSQCSNRWYKVLHPTIRRKGRWLLEEDKRLKWAVSVYGAQKWRTIAAHVPGRTDIQCRERWVNVLDPSVNIGDWTSEEDKQLEELVAKYGEHRWATVAKETNCRTDSQCWRRWKNLHPENQATFHREGQIMRAALPSNFVGRAKERPNLGPQDFVSEIPDAQVVKRAPGRPRKEDGSIGMGNRETSGEQDGGVSDPVALEMQRSHRVAGLKRSRSSKSLESSGADDAETESRSLSEDDLSHEVVATESLPETPVSCFQQTPFSQRRKSVKSRTVDRPHSAETTPGQVNLLPSMPDNPQAIDEFMGLVRMFHSFCKYAYKVHPVESTSCAEVAESSVPGEEATASKSGVAGTTRPSASNGTGVEMDVTETENSPVGDIMDLEAAALRMSTVNVAGATGADSKVATAARLDLEVAAATRAILSWPFAVGMLDLCAATNSTLAGRKKRQSSAMKIPEQNLSENMAAVAAAGDSAVRKRKRARQTDSEHSKRKRPRVQVGPQGTNSLDSHGSPEVGRRKRQRVHADVLRATSSMDSGGRSGASRRKRQRRQADPSANLERNVSSNEGRGNKQSVQTDLPAPTTDNADREGVERLKSSTKAVADTGRGKRQKKQTNVVTAKVNRSRKKGGKAEITASTAHMRELVDINATPELETSDRQMSATSAPGQEGDREEAIPTSVMDEGRKRQRKKSVKALSTVPTPQPPQGKETEVPSGKRRRQPPRRLIAD